MSRSFNQQLRQLEPVEKENIRRRHVKYPGYYNCSHVRCSNFPEYMLRYSISNLGEIKELERALCEVHARALATRNHMILPERTWYADNQSSMELGL